MSERPQPWAMRHAETIFKVVLVVLAALWFLLPIRREPATPRAEAARIEAVRPS